MQNGYDFMQFKTQFDSVFGFTFNVQYDEYIIQCIFVTHVKINWLITPLQQKLNWQPINCFRLELNRKQF